MITDGGAGCCAKGPATTGGGLTEEFPEEGAVGGGRQAKGEAADWEKEQW